MKNPKLSLDKSLKTWSNKINHIISNPIALQTTLMLIQIRFYEILQLQLVGKKGIMVLRLIIALGWMVQSMGECVSQHKIIRIQEQMSINQTLWTKYQGQMQLLH